MKPRKARMLAACVLGCLALAFLCPAPEGQTQVPAKRYLIGDDKSTVGGKVYDGHFLTCDLPQELQMKNKGGSDGAGMCVMSSIEMAARYQGLTEMYGLRDWCAKEPGGAYPEKVDRQLAAWFKEKNMPPIPYLQYEGKTPEEVMALIDKTGRMACITYGYSPRYNSKIAHMTCCPHYRGKYGVCLDNNFPGDDKYEWMAKEELINRMKSYSDSAWVFVWLSPPPCPPPTNN